MAKPLKVPDDTAQTCHVRADELGGYGSSPAAYRTCKSTGAIRQGLYWGC